MLGQRLRDLSNATGALTVAQCQLVGGVLDALDRQRARQTALNRAVAILDAGQGLSRWALALRLESTLTRFDAVGAKRVKAGCRRPTELENCLMVMLEFGPRSAPRLWEEIRNLPPRG